MQLVIDIPEEDYKFIKDLQSLIIGGRGNCKTMQKNVINAIKNGTPYNPSGESISRSELKKAIEQGEGFSWDSHGKDDLCVRKKYIDNAPPVEPTKPHGKWIPISEGLPERCKEVIVTDIEVRDTYTSRYLGDGYWDCDNGPYNNRIIAWMPLPEPYKETDMRKETENDNS